MVNSGTVLLNGNALYLGVFDYSQTAGVTDLGTAGGTIFASLASTRIKFNGGILKGSGAISSATISAGATLSPGASPGLDSIDRDYNQDGGTFAGELNGTDAGVTYDQVRVGGTVTLAGPLALTLGFSPFVGTVFTILDNQSSAAVNGTFTGLPEGATIVFGATALQVSHVGGTGNNVTLKVVAGAPAPTSIAVTATPNPAIVGQPVTLTATVTGVSPTGTVQFKDGDSNLGAPVVLAGGVAMLTTSALSAAAHPITAVYSGDVDNLPSTSAVMTELVNLAAVQLVPTMRQEIVVLLAVLIVLSGAALRRR